MGKRLSTIILAIALIALALPAAAGYFGKLGGATRSGRIYHYTMWDANLIWRATFFNDDYRAAFIDQHAKIEHMTDAEKQTFSDEQWRKQDDGWEFFISMYTKDRLRDFNLFPDSFWKIVMVTGSGEEVHPIAIDSLPVTPYEEVMYPYIDRWSRTYRVVFPKADLGDKIQLTIMSVVGDSSLSWQVKPLKRVRQKKWEEK